MLTTYVINLAGSDQRWEATSSRLKELGVAFERFDAVDGRVNPHPLFSRYDDKLREKYRGRPLSGGELGCFASHYLLWEKCVELNKPIIIMEDDLVIHNSIFEAIDIAEKQILNLHVLRFYGLFLKRRPYKKVRKFGSFELMDHIKGPSGAQCYAISPRAAKAFIKNANIWYMAVDDYMDRYWIHGLNCFSLMPFPIDLADVETQMNRPMKSSRSLKVKLVKALHDYLESIRRFWYRLTK